MGIGAVLLAAWGVVLLRELWRARKLGRENDRRLAEWRARNAAYLAQQVVPHPVMSQRVMPWVFPTPHGRQIGIRVFASCEAEAVEVLYAAYLKMEKVA